MKNGQEKLDEPKGRAKGGVARAKNLTPEQRSEIARQGALARKKKISESKILRATHGSNEHPLKIGDIEIPCYVLEDGTRVLVQTALQTALGLSGGGGKNGRRKIAGFLKKIEDKGIEINDLSLRADSPIKFVLPQGGIGDGFEATVLADICDAVLEARKKDALHPSQYHVARQCEILVRSFAKVGIVALVDEATGYQAVRPSDALQAYLEKIISKELAAWVKKFPDEFYENIYKLRGWPWPGMAKNRYSIVGTYTRDLVFERIAPGLLPELERKSPKNEKGNRSNKLHQWFTEEIGNPMLAQHIHSLIMFQRFAIVNGYGWNRFVKMVDQVLPKKGNNMELALEQ